ncbi:U-box domain-containing protein 52-like isoform X3 [Rhododendron vialii]|uniref:U-box domain-containing protein 52-like isoform X3 n=1 Tax=Rhododendron vialii TaxID=182163 RepID=UPI00265E8094|nr:U-box domain-containing protein 52-like isoform X3 [Rhododendron vialii]XP_058228188.1 U-box domain-containing protein 52-like isoform X3 [Rhododendron vialii]
MWLPKPSNGERKAGGGGERGNGLVAVAVDKDKGSQYALKWAIENPIFKSQTVILIHVVHQPTSASATNHSASCELSGAGCAHRPQLEKQTKELFLTFHCFCTRKNIQFLDVILEDTDIVKALLEYVSYAAIENLILGASSRHGFIRIFKALDVPSNVSKGAPDFCSVYVISKTKISSMRNASRAAPFTSPLHNQIKSQAARNSFDSQSRLTLSRKAGGKTLHKPRDLQDDNESIKSPFARGRRFSGRLWGELSQSEIDISFVSSSGRSSTEDRGSVSSLYDPCNMESAEARTSRMQTSLERSLGPRALGGAKWTDADTPHEFSSSSGDSIGRSSCSSQGLQDGVEAEMRRLKLELKQTMEMYSTACKEALTAKQKAVELRRWRVEEERRLEEARLAEEAARASAEKEKAKCRAAMEAAEAAQRIAKREAQRRINIEMKILGEAEGNMTMESDTLAMNDVVIRYRKYTIDEIEVATDFFAESRKIGEGGYGPVYKCFLDHTPVAVKVLRPDATHGREQFQREVEILSCMRHPNMVLLLGACPEYGCLVYEYMGNGSLEDRIFRRGNTPALSWQIRFRIAAEIATGLLFLHQTKPEPVVHRDLKPANILLDQNYVSKISDVGLARLVPPTVADDVTQYRMTSTAGTFCYIDPEYQQTGMLGVKSDVYSLGIVLLQLITAKPAMGLAHHVGRSIDKGTFAEMLDPTVPDWPVEEALCFAKVAVQCAELRRKDRPDLGKAVLPELNRLRGLADETMTSFTFGGSAGPSPHHSYVSIAQDVISDPVLVHSGCESSKNYSSSSSLT